MPVGAAIGAVGTVAGAGISAMASSKASKAATNAANQNNALQANIYGQNKAILSPYIDTGTKAMGGINALLGLSNDNGAQANAFDAFRNSDGYQFRLDQGLNALNDQYAAKGLIQSGAAMKAINNYAQGQASSEFGNYLGALQGQQQTGLSAGNALAGVGTGYANAVSANNNSAASAQGNAALSGAANMNSLIGTGLSAYALSQGLNTSYGGGGSMSSLPQYNINSGYAPTGIKSIGSY